MPSGAEISPPSSDVVWVIVAGSFLFRSTDRGATWEQRGLPPGTQLARISFLDDRHGWIVTPDPVGPGCPEKITIWRTQDAGATYDKIQPTGLPANACGGALTLLDAQRAFLTGGGNETNPFIYRTTDGGQTWTASAPPKIAGAPDSALSPGAVHAFGATLLVPVLDWSKAPIDRYVYRSTDGGASWTRVASVPRTPSGGAASPFAIATATRWLALAIPGAASVETTDGGATWHPYASRYDQAAPIPPALYFADANVGYATVRGSLQRTTDGGASWMPLTTPGTR